jgi:hypothetical protein
MHLERRDAAFNIVDVKQADLSSITYKVTQAGTVIISPTPITVSTAVYDTLQRGTAWTADEEGLNFSFTIPASAVPNAGLPYDIEFTFQPAGGNPFPVLVQVTTLAVP